MKISKCRRNFIPVAKSNLVWKIPNFSRTVQIPRKGCAPIRPPYSLQRLHKCLGFVHEVEKSLWVVVIGWVNFKICGLPPYTHTDHRPFFLQNTTNFFPILGGNGRGRARVVFPGSGSMQLVGNWTNLAVILGRVARVLEETRVPPPSHLPSFPSFPHFWLVTLIPLSTPPSPPSPLLFPPDTPKLLPFFFFFFFSLPTRSFFFFFFFFLSFLAAISQPSSSFYFFSFFFFFFFFLNHSRGFLLQSCTIEVPPKTYVVNINMSN